MTRRSGPRRPDLPVFVQDQLYAASDEVMRSFESRGAAGEHLVTDAAKDDPVLVALVTAYDLYHAAGLVERCPHLANPRPFFVRMWDRPLKMRCLSCVRTAPVVLTADQEITCDACGKIGPDRKIWPGSVSTGPGVLTFGRCVDCTPKHLRDAVK